MTGMHRDMFDKFIKQFIVKRLKHFAFLGEVEKGSCF